MWQNEKYTENISAANQNAMIISRKSSLWSFELHSELAALFMGYHFHLKEWLTNYHCLELGIQQTFVLEASQYLKAFLVRLVMKLMNVIFLILCYEICQHLKELHNLKNQYFPDAQCVVLQIQLTTPSLTPSVKQTNGS